MFKLHLEQNPGVICFEIYQTLNYDELTIIKKPHAINLIKNLNKWVPYILSEDNKVKLLVIANSLLACNTNEPFIDCFITCDEQWINSENFQRSGIGLKLVKLVE